MFWACAFAIVLAVRSEVVAHDNDAECMSSIVLLQTENHLFNLRGTSLATSSLNKKHAGSGKKHLQPAADVTHKSWFERFGDAMMEVLLGLFVLIPFSVALLWMNEKRVAKLESLIALGEQEVVTIECTQKDLRDYDGTLVHMNSEHAKGLGHVQDDRFKQLEMNSGCIRLLTEVEVFQWQEHEHKKTEKNRVGGGEREITTYTYSKTWSKSIINSSKFHRSGHTNSVHVHGLQPGSREAVNDTVIYGNSFSLPKDLVMDLNNFEDASELLKGKPLEFGDKSFTKVGNYHMCPARSSPEIGDFRVKVTYVLDGPATVLALQMERDRNVCDAKRTFGPYRSIRRGFCGNTNEELKKELRLAAVEQTSDELYEQEKCFDCGPFACLCFCCNIVAYIFTHSDFQPVGGSTFSLVCEIYSAWPGKKTVRECFKSERRAAVLSKWGLRLFGWLVLFIGFCCLFAPLEVLLDIIPFLGPYLGTALSYGVSIISLFSTLLIAFLIVSFAYLVYHPCLGMMYFALFGGIAVAFAYARGM